ncbi:FAD-binding oxidoreductase [Nocardia yamanashiensis]|uniref:FAD-binding oxidoreductase n=1 Tax=Nocardia yamanashiensis TaxID=209247 RepID=UPI001E42D1EA|nr:FAD-binding oxidoreductase [Nocardia yamanashiensis]UGT45179.1 FAD-binding oxidoreductase [Nocardia yamanashiensis]
MTTVGVDIEKLRAAIGGPVIGPGDAEYDLARQVWNGGIDRRPALIVRPDSAAGVAEAVRQARQYGMDLTVRGGGHNYAGHAVADDAMLIDLGGLDAVTVDPAARLARVGGGATWAQVDGATTAHALAVTGGFISTTGVGGLTLGGGMGWLTLRNGLSCDSVVSAEVVTADGRIVTASADENPDLLWALRGGGGNFGIVTEFTFALHDLPPLAQATLLCWTPEDGAAGFAAGRDLVEALPPGYCAAIMAVHAPPAPFVPEKYHFTPGFVVAIVGFDTPEELAAVVQPLRAATPAPAWELVTPMPYTALQQMFDEGAPRGLPAYEKALYVDDLSTEVIATMIEQFQHSGSPLSIMPIFPMRGRYSETPDAATAFGGSRRPCWGINISALCVDPSQYAAERQWVRDCWDALRPHARSGAGYINFLADDDQQRVRDTYGDKYSRLADLKALWDPHNVFHHNANIRPSGK